MKDSRRLAIALCCAALLCLLTVWSWPSARVVSTAEVLREQGWRR